MWSRIQMWKSGLACIRRKNFILVTEYLKQEGEDGVVTEQRSARGGV